MCVRVYVCVGGQGGAGGKYIAGDLKKKVGRFFLGNTPEGSAILGDFKTVSDNMAITGICCKVYQLTLSHRTTNNSSCC